MTDRLLEWSRARVAAARRAAAPYLSAQEEARREVFRRVLAAFRAERVGEEDLAPTTGYGYGDRGRGKLDRVLARALEAEDALVRVQWVSGTHVLAHALAALLRPGDELLAVNGPPYDTLRRVIGRDEEEPGSLRSYGVRYREVDLGPAPTRQQVSAAIGPRTRAVFCQRAAGYRVGGGLTVAAIAEVVAGAHAQGVPVVVDNCYGEFVEPHEPPHVGADLVAGSLIKNPGGGLAPTGGYVAGRCELVEKVAARLTAPGIGREVGPNPWGYRALFQGLFLAPHAVGQALAGAILAAQLFSDLGFPVFPEPGRYRTDIVQGIVLGSPEAMLAFCRAIQAASPVDSHVQPEPWEMPGYADAVVMAGGGFVQGGTLELSADGPLRPPYAVYLQGGLGLEHVEEALAAAVAALARGGFLPSAPALAD